MEHMEEEAPVKNPQLDELKGAFVGSLRRNNKKIRDDRAIAGLGRQNTPKIIVTSTWKNFQN